jgi:hypothetical protein
MKKIKNKFIRKRKKKILREREKEKENDKTNIRGGKQLILRSLLLLFFIRYFKFFFLKHGSLNF